MTYLCTWPACKTAGCIDCNEAVELHDDDEERADVYADEEREPPEFGCCLPPGECCMPGLHFPSECHTAADYEREQFGGWASDAGPRLTPNVRGEARLAAHRPPQTTTAMPQGVASTDQLGLTGPEREER